MDRTPIIGGGFVALPGPEAGVTARSPWIASLTGKSREFGLAREFQERHHEADGYWWFALLPYRLYEAQYHTAPGVIERKLVENRDGGREVPWPEAADRLGLSQPGKGWRRWVGPPEVLTLTGAAFGTSDVAAAAAGGRPWQVLFVLRQTTAGGCFETTAAGVPVATTEETP